MEPNLVAVYGSRGDAELLQDRLIAFGIPATGIRLSSAIENTAVEHAGDHDFAQAPPVKRECLLPSLIARAIGLAESTCLAGRQQAFRLLLET